MNDLMRSTLFGRQYKTKHRKQPELAPILTAEPADAPKPAVLKKPKKWKYITFKV